MIDKEKIIRFILLLLLSSFVSAADLNVEIEVGKVFSYEAAFCKRTLSMDPKVATIINKGFGSVEILGGRVGTTSVLIWAEKRITINVSVFRPKIVLSDRARERKKIQAMKNSILIDLNASYYSSYEGDSFSSQKQATNASYSGTLKIEAPFLYGMDLRMMNNIQREGDRVVLEFESLGVDKIPWLNEKKTSFLFGKTTPQTYTVSLLASPKIKGFTWFPTNILPYSKKPLYFGVSVGKRYIDNNYGGFSTSLFNIGSGGSLYQKSDDKITKMIFRYDLGKGYSNDKTSLFFEYGKNDRYNERNFIGVKLSTDNLFGAKFAAAMGGDIEDDLHHEISLYKKLNTIKYRFSHKNTPEDSYSLNGSRRRYSQRDRFAIDYSLKGTVNVKVGSELNYSKTKSGDEFENIWDLDSYLNFNFESYTLSGSFRYSDETETLFPSTSLDFQLGMSGSIKQLFLPINWSLSYTNNEHEYENEESSYITNYYTGSLNCNLLRRLSYAFSYSMSEQKTLATKSESQYDTERIRHRLGYGFSLFSGSVGGSFSLNYSTYIRKYNTELTNDSEKYSVSLSLNSRPTPFSNLRFNISTYKTNSNLNSEKDIDQNDIDEANDLHTRLGIQYSHKFYTLFGWKPKTEIKAIVFYDKNVNSEYDEGIDLPVEGVDILLDDKLRGQTDESGKFYVGKIRGFSKKVSLTDDALPKGYIYSTMNTYTFDKMKSSKETCYFGFVLNTEISGYLFNDLNGDGIMQHTEPGIPNVDVTLSNGKTMTTNLNGRYVFAPVPQGEFVVKINPFSIPEGYRSKSSLKQEFEIKHGSVIQRNLPFNAARSLKVVCYLLKKKKQSFLKDFAIRLNDKEKKTKKKGSVKFRNVDMGRQYVSFMVPEGLEIDTIKSPEESLSYQKTGLVKFKLFYSHKPGSKLIEIIFKEKKKNN